MLFNDEIITEEDSAMGASVLNSCLAGGQSVQQRFGKKGSCFLGLSGVPG